MTPPSSRTALPCARIGTLLGSTMTPGAFLALRIRWYTTSVSTTIPTRMTQIRRNACSEDDGGRRRAAGGGRHATGDTRRATGDTADAADAGVRTCG